MMNIEDEGKEKERKRKGKGKEKERKRKGKGKRRALITGITGQDGSYSAEFLLKKDYEVHGLIRRASTFNTERIDHLYIVPHDPKTRIFLHYGDFSDSGQLTNLIYNTQPEEIYHLGAQSHVPVCFDMPENTGDIIGIGNNTYKRIFPKRE
jgi:GDPmannose 4,6-dehydratase